MGFRSTFVSRDYVLKSFDKDFLEKYKAMVIFNGVITCKSEHKISAYDNFFQDLQDALIRMKFDFELYGSFDITFIHESSHVSLVKIYISDVKIYNIGYDSNDDYYIDQKLTHKY